MKMPRFFPRKKLRASTARRSLGLPDEMDYEQMSEPNMKLSRALLIVLVLHVVAVAGIIAFNTIKPRPGVSTPSSKTTGTSTQSETRKENAVVAASPSPAAKHDSAKPAHTPEKIIAKIGPKTEEPKRVEKALPVSTPSKSYVVEKGDTPVK